MNKQVAQVETAGHLEKGYGLDESPNSIWEDLRGALQLSTRQTALQPAGRPSLTDQFCNCPLRPLLKLLQFLGDISL